MPRYSKERAVPVDFTPTELRMINALVTAMMRLDELRGKMEDGILIDITEKVEEALNA